MHDLAFLAITGVVLTSCGPFTAETRFGRSTEAMSRLRVNSKLTVIELLPSSSLLR
jgi:hypothetical protein